MKTFKCERCSDQVPANAVTQRTRRLSEVLSWHPECYRLDHPQETQSVTVPGQRVESTGNAWAGLVPVRN